MPTPKEKIQNKNTKYERNEHKRRPIRSNYKNRKLPRTNVKKKKTQIQCDPWQWACVLNSNVRYVNRGDLSVFRSHRFNYVCFYTIDGVRSLFQRCFSACFRRTFFGSWSSSAGDQVCGGSETELEWARSWGIDFVLR